MRTEDPRSPAAVEETAPAPSMTISLVGTITVPDGTSYGLFRNAEGRQAAVRPGEPVFDVGTLKRIEAGHAVITAGDREVTIPLVSPAGRGEPANPYADVLRNDNPFIAQSAMAAATHSSEEDAPIPKYIVVDTPDVRSIDRWAFEVNREWVRRSVAQRDGIQNDARLQQNIVNGEQHGIQLSSVRNRGFYENLGLTRGDVLTQVNDRSLNSFDDVLRELSSGPGEVRLQVMRRGEPVTLTYQMK